MTSSNFYFAKDCNCVDFSSSYSVVAQYGISTACIE